MASVVNIEERIKMLKAMEFIMQHVRNEEYLFRWQNAGVAEGEVRYGDLEVCGSDAKRLEYYLGREEFIDTMSAFLTIMSGAKQSGGIVCDGLCSVRQVRW